MKQGGDRQVCGDVVEGSAGAKVWCGGTYGRWYLGGGSADGHLGREGVFVREMVWKWLIDGKRWGAQRWERGCGSQGRGDN